MRTRSTCICRHAPPLPVGARPPQSFFQRYSQCLRLLRQIPRRQGPCPTMLQLLSPFISLLSWLFYTHASVCVFLMTVQRNCVSEVYATQHGKNVCLDTSNTCF